MARSMAPLDEAGRIAAEGQARQKLNEEAESVMANSKPTPTQQENDLSKTGVMHPDDKEDPNNPEMPPVAEQQRRVSEASGEVPHAAQTQRRSTEAQGSAPYMTREAVREPPQRQAQSTHQPAHQQHSSARAPSPAFSSEKPGDKDKPAG